MTLTPRPRVRRTAHNVQCSFLLPHCIHDVATYPVLSPQGAAIIIYAHDNGITLLWRGGRQLVPQPTLPTNSNHNGPNGPPNGVLDEDAIMVLDPDDDAPATTLHENSPFLDKPYFKTPEPKDRECPTIIQTLDLSFGTPVYNIATLPISPCSAEDAPFEGANLLRDTMVFAISGSSSDVYLVMLPLTPPSEASKARPDLRNSLVASLAGSGAWGESVFSLGGQAKASDGIAINLAKVKSPGSAGSPSATVSRLVVASHTHEASGTLRLWDVKLDEKPTPHAKQPFQTEYLPRPLTSISFNPAYGTQILATTSPHAVRIYDFASPALPPEDNSTGSLPPRGSWLLSLYPPFLRHSSRRKPILATAWVCHGKAILTLLADGQWGVWDIGGANPSSTLLAGRPTPGIKGTTFTYFTISGFIEGTSGLRNPTSQKQLAGGGDFVPMTPHTRKEALLASTSGPERLHAIRGGITVAPLPSRGATKGDESVVMWLGGSEHVVVVPGIAAFWASQERRGKSDGGGVNLFSGTTPTRMVRLDTLVAGLMGERCNGVAAIVRLEKDGASSDVEQGVPIDIVVRGDRRLVIVRMGERGAGDKIGGVVGWKRKLGEHAKSYEPANAIAAHPRLEKPGSVAFNLSVMPGGSLRSRATGIAESPPMQSQLPESSHQPIQQPLPKARASGLTFVEQISRAADSEVEGEDRNVEEEMLDIMEIDRELENMEDERQQGRKKVFFEEGFDDNAF